MEQREIDKKLEEQRKIMEAKQREIEVCRCCSGFLSAGISNNQVVGNRKTTS